MLHRDEVLRFLARANELYPGVHTRLYTSGDRLDEALLRQLAHAGLTEIRFSVKPPDADAGAEARAGAAGAGTGARSESPGMALPEDAFDDPVWERIEAAVGVIPDVVIELPVIPGTLEWMKRLMRRADALGVRGINLLEFCFPLHNAEEFARRGFRLRKHPYRYLYDYWYGGGIPVAGSEAEALALMEFACEVGLGMGVHYCSSDNKNTGQIYQQNSSPEAVAFVRRDCPWMAADPEERFLKCAKAFGADAAVVRDWLREAALGPWGFDEDVPCVSFPVALASEAGRAVPTAQLAESVAVVERRDDGAPYLREVAIRALSGEPQE